jgi:hypothetical protein
VARIGPSGPGDSKEGEDFLTTEEMASFLALTDKAFGAVRVVLAMMGQYFTDVVQ